MNKPTPSLNNAALVLVGHGSQRNPGSSRATRAHADALASRGIFASVHAVFLKEAPFLNHALDDLDAPHIYIVPTMASKGYLTETLIPSTLKLTGPVTERITADGRQKIILCDPIGTHPKLLDAAAKNVAAVIAGAQLKASDTCVLVAGHGNPKNPENADQTRRVATRIRQDNGAASVICAFLEETPFIRDWKSDSPARNVVVMPFLISGGLHGAEDVPNLMGLSPDDKALTALGAGAPVAGPYAVDGRNIWYLRPIGTDAVVEDIILDRVNRAQQG